MTFSLASCPQCETGYRFHAKGCELAGFDYSEIERAYVDILSRLTAPEAPWTYDDLRGDVAATGEMAEADVSFASTDTGSMDHPGWTPLHTACLHELKRVGRAVETDDGIVCCEPGEYQQGVIPQHDPMRSVYEYGPIDGCKDYAVYSLVSWCELIELDWEQTVAFIDHWLNETGRWDSEGWGESSPKQLVESKRHIYDRGLGWGDYPKMAKTEMEASSKSRQVDADEMAGLIDRELLSSVDP